MTPMTKGFAVVNRVRWTPQLVTCGTEEDLDARAAATGRGARYF